MSLDSARRPHFRTADLHRLQAKARTRRLELNAFFSDQLDAVKTRLSAACRPYDRQRRAVHLRQVKTAHACDVSDDVCEAAGTGKKPQLWQVEGDPQ